MNSPVVMSPWEIRCHLGFLAGEMKPDPLARPIFERMEQFVDDWVSAWAQFGPDDSGRPAYAGLIEQARGDVLALGSNERRLLNDWPLHGMFESLIFQMALAAPAPPIAVRATVGAAPRGYPRVAR
jgi:hypothetical protein